MAFKLTYTDGQADDYDDSTKWAVEDGVLKMGRRPDEWTILVSPSHWATIEVTPDKDRGQTKDKDDEDNEKGKDDEGAANRDKDGEDGEGEDDEDKDRADKDR